MALSTSKVYLTYNIIISSARINAAKSTPIYIALMSHHTVMACQYIIIMYDVEI